MHKTEFHCRNLFEVTADDLRGLGRLDNIWSIRRERGYERCVWLWPSWRWRSVRNASSMCRCNPGSLARDAGILVEKAGYQLKARAS